MYSTFLKKQMYRRLDSKDWDFKDSNTKEYTHGYHNYPAMMIPQIARKLINEYSPEGKVNLLFDPYMGSGTSLVEASIVGINSIGTDINPLACLISKVKTTAYNIEEIKTAYSVLHGIVINYHEEMVLSTDFTHITSWDYWYSKESLLKLSFIQQCIDALADSVKDFFRLALAETVREVSFTRNGEFKRFRMQEEKIKNFSPDVIKVFDTKVCRNIKGLAEYEKIENKGTVSTYTFNSSQTFPDNVIVDNSVDIIVTSPPYGDSRTTVAYGQFSRWANEWFGFENAKTLDNHLMGGKTTKDVLFKSVSIVDELKTIESLDKKRYLEVVSFLNDYNASIINVSKKVRQGGRICYVVGNRTVKGIQIPLDYFTAEMFEQNGFKHEVTIVRSMPNKRMPSKTSPTNEKGKKVSTMNNEYIVVMTKQ